MIYGRMPAKITGVMVGYFEIRLVDGFDGTLPNEFIQKLGRMNIGYRLQPFIITSERIQTVRRDGKDLGNAGLQEHPGFFPARSATISAAPILWAMSPQQFSFAPRVP